MFIYNLLIFILTRTKTYFFYVLFIVSWIFFQFTLNGFRTSTSGPICRVGQ